MGRDVKLREMDEKNMHNLFLKNMSGLIEETKNPSPCMNPWESSGVIVAESDLCIQEQQAGRHGDTRRGGAGARHHQAGGGKEQVLGVSSGQTL